MPHALSLQRWTSKWAIAALVFLTGLGLCRLAFRSTWSVAVGVSILPALGVLGWLLWLRHGGSDPRESARSTLGTGLLVGVLVSGTIAAAQAIEQNAAEERARAQTAATALDDLRLTLSLRANSSGVTLSHVDLTGIDLAGKDLSRAQMIGTILNGSILSATDLRGSYLQGAALTRSQLVDVNLTGAHLEHADLNGSDLNRASLKDATATGVQCLGCDLDRADLRGAFMAHAELSGNGTAVQTRMEYADLNGAHLPQANLTNSLLSHSSLRGAVLGNANLAHTDLTYADLRSADLQDADLRGSDLSHADLNGADLNGARYDKDTSFPRQFRLQRSGAIFQL